jgi:serine/threonine-protein kinase HipA
MERCDFDTGSGQYQGYEEFCGLLGLHPDHRYDSSWERLARLTGDYVMPIGLRRAKEQLAVTLLLSLVLGNADCHARSMGFVYSNFNDVQLAPICGMMTTSVYDAEVQRPTALHLDGAKTWNPGKGLWRYLQQHLGVENARQRELVDLVCTSVSERVADVTQHITHTPGFAEIGRSMLRHWSDGILRLSDRLTLPVPDISEISRVQECAELEANPATGDATAPASHKKKRGAASPASAADNAEQLKLLFE